MICPGEQFHLIFGILEDFLMDCTVGFSEKQSYAKDMRSNKKIGENKKRKGSENEI
jgi:hypothetical protein